MVATEKKKTSLDRAVFSGSLGNMLEWFDYGLYGYFAAIISADFFVADDPIVGLLLRCLWLCSRFCRVSVCTATSEC